MFHEARFSNDVFVSRAFVDVDCDRQAKLVPLSEWCMAYAPA